MASYMPKLYAMKVKLLLDCGAFSAWRARDTIDLDAYIDFVKENSRWIWQTVALDSIPGEWGTARTTTDVERSASISFRNLERMKRAGLRPVPVFHQGEDFKWLERMIQAGETLVGISPSDDTHDDAQVRWLDDVFTTLTDEHGAPLIKTHGFGVGALTALRRYPWFSVDSSTWVINSGFSQIFVPPYVNDKPDYWQKPIRVFVSDQVISTPGAQAMQFDALGPLTQERVRRFVVEECKSTIAEIRYDQTARWRAAIVYYLNFEKRARAIRFANERKGFRKHAIDTSRLKPITDLQMRMVFAAIPDPRRVAVLTEMNANRRLLSYWFLKNKPDLLRSYVETGLIPRKQRRVGINWNSTAYINHRNLQTIKHLARSNNDAEPPWSD